MGLLFICLLLSLSNSHQYNRNRVTRANRVTRVTRQTRVTKVTGVNRMSRVRYLSTMAMIGNVLFKVFSSS